MSDPLFPLGQVVATPGALSLLEANGRRQYDRGRSNDPSHLVQLGSQYDTQLAHREPTSERFYAGSPVRSADGPSVVDSG